MTTTEISEALQGYAAASGLIRIAEAKTPTPLNDTATLYYQQGPVPVARVAEQMISDGQIIPTATGAWWPSALEILSTLDCPYPIQGNPPRVVATHAATGNTVLKAIGGPTQAHLDAAVAAVNADLSTRDVITRQLVTAQREMDRS